MTVRLAAAVTELEGRAAALLDRTVPDGEPRVPDEAVRRCGDLVVLLARGAVGTTGDQRRAVLDLLLRAERLDERARRLRVEAQDRARAALDAGLDALWSCTSSAELRTRAGALAATALAAERARLVEADGLTPERGVLRAQVPTSTGRTVLEVEGSDDAGGVQRFADALGVALDALAARERLRAQGRALAPLREALDSVLRSDDGPASGFPVPDDGAASVVREGTSSWAAALTVRQRETLELLARGLSNAEIAERLVVGVATVKSHVSAVLRAAGALNRAEAVARYVADGSSRAYRG
ncbi:MAG: LuxR family transcriptional regulator [Frankiales bacterium]|nr:LuxR family transcriptional regulator [Frankiales bacterium]